MPAFNRKIKQSHRTQENHQVSQPQRRKKKKKYERQDLAVLHRQRTAQRESERRTALGSWPPRSTRGKEVSPPTAPPVFLFHEKKVGTRGPCVRVICSLPRTEKMAEPIFTRNLQIRLPGRAARLEHSDPAGAAATGPGAASIDIPAAFVATVRSSSSSSAAAAAVGR